MPSKELIEKVAQAIYEHRHKGMKNIWSWDESGLDDEHPGERERYIGYAQVALSTILAALQEPTEGMLDAGCKAWGVDINADETRENIANEWRQMLAASALGEQSE